MGEAAARELRFRFDFQGASGSVNR